MKKFLKVFIPITLILGGLSLAICYIVIPQETKSAADIVIGYLNTPLGIVGGTTITLGLVASVIIKLIYDRYKDTIRDDLEKAKRFVEQQKEQAKDYYENALKEKEEIETILSSYSQRIDELLNNIVLVCETSPNAKVKALGETIKNGGEQLKQELKDKLEELDNEFANAIDKKSEVQELEDRINQLTEQVERLVNQYGGEETTND